MIALGWTRGAPLPDWVFSEPVQDLDLVLIPKAPPVEVLRAQERLAALGIDLLPLAPAQQTTQAAARALTKAAAPRLAAQLEALRGQAQTTLHLTWTDPPADLATGTAWLADKRRRQARGLAAEAWLTRLAEALALPATPVERRGSSALLHLLVPRDAPLRPEDLARTEAPEGDFRLTLVGPWPPLAFARIAA